MPVPAPVTMAVLLCVVMVALLLERSKTAGRTTPWLHRRGTKSGDDSWHQQRELSELHQHLGDPLYDGGVLPAGQRSAKRGGELGTRAAAVEKREQAQRGRVAHLHRLMLEVGHRGAALRLPARERARFGAIARDRYDRGRVERGPEQAVRARMGTER